MRRFERTKEIFKKGDKKVTRSLKKKGKYFNCDKKRHFARECRSFKTNNIKSDNFK
jgi:hypothetical protein